MKRFLSCLAFVVCFHMVVFGQQSDENPVLMTVAGKPVTRAEFEYAYNKNNNIEGAVEHKTVEEYAEMFLNYKLKVAEAESQRIDTLTSFITEFRSYRDMQLTPHLVDQAYIDSVARSLYDKQAERIAGRDLIDCSHILLLVKQTDSEPTASTMHSATELILQQWQSTFRRIQGAPHGVESFLPYIPE